MTIMQIPNPHADEILKYEFLEKLNIQQYLCQFSPESRKDFNGKLSFKRGLAEVVILKNSVKVFRKFFLM